MRAISGEGIGVRTTRLILLAGLVALVTLSLGVGSATAITSVGNSNRDFWAVNDAAPPGLDTGSVETTRTGSLLGFGGIRLQVDGAAPPRMNGVLLRGFGFTYDGGGTFTSSRSVELGGVAVARSFEIERADSYARYFDTFTDTTGSPLSIDVAFGGQLGGRADYSGPYVQSSIVASSSGDRTAAPNDSWVEVATGEPSVRGPVAVVLGTPGSGNLTRTGNWLERPFTNPLASGGDEGNQYGFVNHLTLAPGETKAIVHFVATGLSETKGTPAGGPTPAAGSQLAAVEDEGRALAATPDLGGLSTAELCAIGNFSEAAIAAAVPGFSAAACAGAVLNTPPPADAEPEATTGSPYDVVGKTIVQELADMGDGATDSQEIVSAYLDRITAYDGGPFGFHAFISVNGQALAEAREADRMRAEGSTLPLLGIPIAVKDIYDTEEMATTGGSLAFAGFQPLRDAWLVARLRAAGAIVIGKTNLAEFAENGYFSESAFGKTWNAFDPSKSSIGSSGGSAVAVATSMAAAALGTQTGDSLWGPASAASLVSLRGTDGQTSTQGVMPLTYIQDYAGALTRTAEDQALVLNAISGVDPGDPTQALEGVGWEGRRPADWRSTLDSNALQGKRIGYFASAFADPFGTTDTSERLRAEFVYFVAAGATMVPIPGPPDGPNEGDYFSGDLAYEGWVKWIEGEPNSPYSRPEEIIDSPVRLPNYRSASPYGGSGAMTEAQIKGFVAYRQAYRQELTGWMDGAGVDAVVFPGELSNIHLNDSVVPSFGRRDPQASSAGVPTVIFPAGENSAGQPGDLQLEGRPYSDDQLLGMAFAFEQQANGHRETGYAPALRYVPGGGAIPARSGAPATSSRLGPPAAARARLLGVKVRSSGLVLRFACQSSSDRCSFFVRLTVGGAALPRRRVGLAPGAIRSVRLKPTTKAERKLEAPGRTRIVVGMTPLHGSEVAAARTRLFVE